jgi:translation initiation factor 2 alpha subunit (eIF-2alpha)
MIAPNEITKFTNIKGVHKILREGKIEVLKVITVDEKGIF